MSLLNPNRSLNNKSSFAICYAVQSQKSSKLFQIHSSSSLRIIVNLHSITFHRAFAIFSPTSLLSFHFSDRIIIPKCTWTQFNDLFLSCTCECLLVYNICNILSPFAIGYFNQLIALLPMQYRGSISSLCCINSEASASELLENLEEIFSCYIYQ